MPSTPGSVVVCLLMAYFLMWLWSYSPKQEDEVSAWLDDHGLAAIRRSTPVRGVRTCTYMRS